MAYYFTPNLKRRSTLGRGILIRKTDKKGETLGVHTPFCPVKLLFENH
jgi:hypothetical protein